MRIATGVLILLRLDDKGVLIPATNDTPPDFFATVLALLLIFAFAHL